MKKNCVYALLLAIFSFYGTASLYAQQTPPAQTAVQEPAPAEVAVRPVTTSQTISLDFKDAEIGTVLRVISLKSGVNIVAGPEVSGVVTIRLENVAWEKALDVILRTYNYVYERDGNVIRVTTRDKMQLEPVDTKTFVLNYTKASEVQSAVQDILTERGRVKVAERMNMLIVTDIPTNIFHISQVIERLDKMTAQAYIDSKVIRTQENLTKNIGVNWNVTASAGGASRPFTFPFAATGDQDPGPNAFTQFFPNFSTTSTANPGNLRGFPTPASTVTGGTYALGTLDFTDFTSVLSMIEGDTKTKVVSNPRIVVLNNQTAKVQVGDQIPIPSFERNEQTGSMEVTGFTYRDTGVVLNVTPHINDANEILVDLRPEVSAVGDNISFGPDFEAPTFTTTAATTQVLIQSGQTIAIGGLLTDNDGVTNSKVPYFADIPLIGKLFRSQSATPATNTDAETLFFVTVTSVDSSGQPISNPRKDDTSSQDQASTPDTQATSSQENASSGASQPAPAAA